MGGEGEGSCETESQNGGCLYLVSSGTSPEESHFLDASTNGDDVFFFTRQQLVPADGDHLFDVYDASVGGGLASQHQLTPPTCSSTACQANPAPPPDPSTASSSYRGAGNVHKAPSGQRCPKGKRKVRRRGKVRCQKAASTTNVIPTAEVPSDFGKASAAHPLPAARWRRPARPRVPRRHPRDRPGNLQRSASPTNFTRGDSTGQDVFIVDATNTGSKATSPSGARSPITCRRA